MTAERVALERLADAIDPRVKHDKNQRWDFVWQPSNKDLIAASDALRQATRPSYVEGVEAAAKALPTLMQEEWSDFCSDAGAHPDDIKRHGRKLFYEPYQWTEAIQQRIRALTPPTDETVVERVAEALADKDGDSCLFHPERNMLKGHGPGECEACDAARERYRIKARTAITSMRGG